MEEKINDYLEYLRRYSNKARITLEEANRHLLPKEVATYYGVDNESPEVLEAIKKLGEENGAIG